MFRKFAVFLVCGLLTVPAAFADPDLPGATANLQTIPTGSLIIPMDTANQTIAGAEDFNLAAFGLVNKLLQNNIPVLWAIRSDKVKLTGTTTGANNSTSLIDATANFVTAGVEVGDLVTNTSKNPMTRSRVTAVAATTLTLSAIDAIDFDTGNRYIIDGHDFTANAARIRPSAVAAADTVFAGGPFIVSNAVPSNVAKALEIMTGVSDGVPPVLPEFDDTAAQVAVRVFQTATPTNNVDVRYNLTHKPFAAVSDVNTDIHASILMEAGIPGATSKDGKDGTWTNCSPLPGQPGFDPNSCNFSVINPVQLSSIECATIHLEPHRATQQQGQTVSDIVTAVDNFVQGGGNFVAQCHSVQYFENDDVDVPPNLAGGGNFMTSLGAADNGVNGDQQYPNSPMPFGQMTGPLDGAQGGSIPRWTLNGGTYDKNNAYINTQNISPNATTHRSATAKVPTGGNLGGIVMYLGGHEYNGAGELEQINGRRMVLNALFIPPDRPQNCGLTVNASLIIKKEVVNDNGGTAVVGDFGVATDAGALVFDGGVVNGSTTTYTAQTLTVLAGNPYSLTENDIAGYTPGTWSCTGTVDNTGGGAFDAGTVTPQPGETKTCTITNDDDAPQLTIVKRIVNDNGGNATVSTFGITSNAPGGGALSFDAGVADGANTLKYTATALTVSANTAYSLVENNVSGYTEGTWSCVGGDDAGGGAFGSGSVTLAPGVSKTCTITNNDEAASLIIVKRVVNDNGGTADADVFGITSTAGAVSFGAGAADGTDTLKYTATTLTVDANTPYSLVENNVTGYSEGSWTCAGGDNAGGGAFGSGSVTLGSGVTKTCTITNNDDAASLIVRKRIVNTGGGTAVVGDFGITTSAGALSFGAAVDEGGNSFLYTASTLTVDANTAYTLQENDIASYNEGTWVCTGGDNQGGGAFDSGSVTLANGVTKTCTIQNTHGEEVVNLKKEVVSVTENPSGTFVVVYRVTASNTGDAAGVYDIDDTFTPGTGVTLQSGTTIAYETGPGANGTVTSPFASGGKPVDDQDIDAGDTDTWLITATFVVNPATATLASLDCDSYVDPATNTGTANGVLGSATDVDLTDNRACAPLPQVNLAKTVFSITEGPSGTFAVVYSVTATNNGLASGKYNIVDTFTPGTGVTLQGGTATITYFSGDGSSGVVTSPFSSGGTPVSGATIGAGKTDVWRVSATFVVNPATATVGSLDCGSFATPGTQTGTANGVTGSGTDLNQTDNRACEPLPQVDLAKSVSSFAEDPSGTFTVVYTVTATNNGDGNGLYNLVDTFTPGAGITLTSAELTSYNAGTENNQSGAVIGGSIPASFNSGQTVVAGESLAAGLNESWSITAVYSVDRNTATSGSLGCTNFATPGTQTGTANGVTGSGTDINTTNNRACAPAPQINLAKSVLSSQNTGGDNWQVVYRVTATNNGGSAGVYNLVDDFSPGNGITLASAQLTSYNAGSENSQTGVLTYSPLPADFPDGANIVTGEGLAAGLNESWTITANFIVSPFETDETIECSAVRGGENTGFYNFVDGSATDLDLDDNDACDEPEIDRRTTFRVTKDFTDDNPMDVDVTINCFTGLPLTQTQQISETRDVVFVVESFEPGTLDCDIDEAVPHGYSPTYYPSILEGAADDPTADDLGCHFDNVEYGRFLCHIVNTPDPVEVVVEKLWVIEGSGGDLLDQHFKLTLYCNGEIIDGDENCDGLEEETTALPSVSEPSYESCKVFEGNGSQTFTAQVIPEYPTTHCWVKETIYDDQVEIQNDCYDLVISAAEGGDSCLITNTVFYEGIPTLSQYGLAILALLMLGVGLIGFRRYV